MRRVPWRLMQQQQLWTVTSCCVTVNSVSRQPRTMSSRCCRLLSEALAVAAQKQPSTVFWSIFTVVFDWWTHLPCVILDLHYLAKLASRQKMALDGLWRDNEVRLYAVWSEFDCVWSGSGGCWELGLVNWSVVGPSPLHANSTLRRSLHDYIHSTSLCWSVDTASGHVLCLVSVLWGMNTNIESL